VGRSSRRTNGGAPGRKPPEAGPAEIDTRSRAGSGTRLQPFGAPRSTLSTMPSPTSPAHAVLLVLLAASIACDKSTALDALGPADAHALDASGGADASAAEDASPRSDAQSGLDALEPDLGPRADAAQSPDAEGLPDAVDSDAGETSDGGAEDGSTCDNIGEDCTGANKCSNGYDCLMGHCLPHDTCGGFVMAQCPSSAPICDYFIGADYGPCFTRAQKACACARPGFGTVIGCP
jgi:hypothetical protein